LAILKIQVHRDRSKELADNRRFTLAANIEVYFCDPQTPWQRGSKFEEGPLLCRFSDAGMPRPSPRSDSRRPKSAKARNRGVWGTDSAAVLWGFGVGVSVGEVEPTLAIAPL
jgi:hypothetical protein